MKYFTTIFRYNDRVGCQEWSVLDDAPALKYLEKGENPPRAIKFILAKLGAAPDEVEFLWVEPFSTKGDMEHYTNMLISKRDPEKGFND